MRIDTHEIIELIRCRAREIAEWNQYIFTPADGRAAFLANAERIIELANAIPTENSK